MLSAFAGSDAGAAPSASSGIFHAVTSGPNTFWNTARMLSGVPPVSASIGVPNDFVWGSIFGSTSATGIVSSLPSLRVRWRVV